MSDFSISIPSLNIITASQGSGKSHLIRYICYELRKQIDYAVVFSNTFFDNDPFDYIKDGFVHPEFNEEVVENMMEIQAKLVEKNKIKEALMIFDDCLDDLNQWNSPCMKKLTTQLRHYHITVIIATQYCNIIPARVRANAMNVFMFYSDNKNSLEALYNSYGQQFETYNDFKQYILTKTGNYKFIYFNKTKNEGSIEKNFKVNKCPEKIPKFKIKYNPKI